MSEDEIEEHTELRMRRAGFGEPLTDADYNRLAALEALDADRDQPSLLPQEARDAIAEAQRLLGSASAETVQARKALQVESGSSAPVG